MIPRRKTLVLFVLFAILLAACGRAASEPQFAMERLESGESMPAEAPAYEEEALGIAADTVDQSFESDGQTDIPQQRLIIRTADMSLVVTDTADAMKRIAAMAEQNGGWVVSSNVFQYDENTMSGNITIRVPAEGFNSALEALQAMAVEVQSINTSGQDVTEEYVDLSSRLANLEATADRVRGFLDETENVEEALAVNQELSRLEGEIEVIKGRMKYLSESAAFSTISVQLTPDVLAQPIETGGWQPLVVLRNAIETLVAALQSLVNLLIWLVIVIAPLLLLVLLPVFLIIWFVRRRKRKPTSAPEQETE
jgi:hypothetical protein